MKKLNLALLCLACVAMLASCKNKVENPEPTVKIHEEEGFVKDGDQINVNEYFKFGFDVASNAETGKELKSLVVTYAGETETLDLTGLKEYFYTNEIKFTVAKDDILEESITATVTDVDDETATATINLTINLAQPLATTPIEWVKIGHSVQDLSAYGLLWKTTNYKDPFTHILPAEGCTLYACSGYGDDYAELTTDVELAAYFQKLMEMTVLPASINTEEYNKVDCNASANYNDLLITKDASGAYHAILIKRAQIASVSAGTQITITGEAK